MLIKQAKQAPRRSIGTRFRNCAGGMAAVEFGLLIPVLLTFWLGSNEFGQALMLDRRVTTTASTVADLIAQSDRLTQDQLDGYLNVADQVMAPALMSLYKENSMRLTVMNVTKDQDGNLNVKWSRMKDGQSIGPASNFPEGPITAAQIDPDFDPAIILENSEQVIAIAEYDYVPTVGRFIKRDLGGVMTLKETFYLAPRKGFVTIED
ncbi:MAG: TadE/TadG family type IV pilus assembly protein [Pseudomonadota bacterium]